MNAGDTREGRAILGASEWESDNVVLLGAQVVGLERRGDVAVLRMKAGWEARADRRAVELFAAALGLQFSREVVRPIPPKEVS